MTPKQEENANRLIDKHVAMSGQTLDALRRAGVKESDEVQIEFSFNASSEKAAKSLAAHLESNDCLNVAIGRSGGFLSRKFFVTGRTYPTNISVEKLGQWIPWIVVQGVIHDCEFDGWGAEV